MADLAEACGVGGHSPRFAPDLQSRTARRTDLYLTFAL